MGLGGSNFSLAVQCGVSRTVQGGGRVDGDGLPGSPCRGVGVERARGVDQRNGIHSSLHGIETVISQTQAKAPLLYNNLPYNTHIIIVHNYIRLAHTLVTIEFPVVCAGTPVRKSSMFPARSVHLRPSRHPEFRPCFMNFKSRRSLYLGA